MLKLHKTRQFLEKEKADTYTGILSCLTNEISTDMMEKITRQYLFLCRSKEFHPTTKEKVNFVYVNVVLSCLKLESKLLQPYKDMVNLLFQVLREQIPLSENLPFYFIVVLLSWPEPTESYSPVYGVLEKYISQMKTSYHAKMKEMYNGKSPVIHFILGKKPGYERLVHIGGIKKCIVDGQEQFASMWGSGKIWNEKKLQELLYRGTGMVKNNSILADTCFPTLKIEVAPMYRSQISGHAEGSKVSFFIGFSMRGPMALDIELKV